MRPDRAVPSEPTGTRDGNGRRIVVLTLGLGNVNSGSAVAEVPLDSCSHEESLTSVERGTPLGRSLV